MLRILLLAPAICLLFCGNGPVEAVEDSRPERITVRSGELTVTGELWLPRSTAPLPAVVLIPGDGGALPAGGPGGFQTSTRLAEALSREGVAALLCLPRAAPEVTLKDRAADAAVMIDYLRKREGIDPSRIGICGHSQGGVIAPLVATRSVDVKFMVLLAPPCLPPVEMALSILEGIWRDAGASGQEIARMKRTERRFLSALSAGQAVEPFRKELLSLFEGLFPRLSAGQRRLHPDASTYARSMVEPQIAMATRPAARFLLSYDSAATLRKVRCPVLALFGKEDTKVPFAENRKALTGALAEGGNPNVVSLVVPHADHLLQGVTPLQGQRFPPGVTDLVAGWIRIHMQTTSR